MVLILSPFCTTHSALVSVKESLAIPFNFIFLNPFANNRYILFDCDGLETTVVSVAIIFKF
jgi:hypothetical protein